MATREQTQQVLGAAIGDKYEVMQWIGGGGMAEVYLVRHRLHGGFCAVKVLAEHLSHDEAIVQLFLQEARTAANLDGHSNVVRIVDIGENLGRHYLIMQYVEGEDLAAYLQRAGRLTPPETVYVAAQIADALYWAHSKGVVHRDLKPANVRLDTHGRAIVLDFGIAKIGSMPTALTQMGVKVGTPYYMAPEHIRGLQIDHRADLYALGVMMFEMVIGKRPFGGESNEAVWHAHVSVVPPAANEVDPAVPPALSHIIQRLLEKDPDKRYQSADKVVEHLKTLGVQEAPPSLRPRSGLDLAGLRSEATSGLAASSVQGGASWPASPAPSKPRTPPPEPASRPEPVSPGEASAPRPKRLSLVFAGLAAVLLLALGVTVYLASRSEPEAPPAASPSQPLAELIQTSTGEMLLIPAGEFTFGADPEISLPLAKPEGFESPNPQQRVHLADFYLDVTEVSNAAYKQFCDATGRPYPGPPADDPAYFETKLDHPVVNVSFADAAAFAEWAGKRLPTEQEWEKAARGIDGRIYPWGNRLPGNEANTDGPQDGFEGVAPVHALPAGASPYGLLNMSGNVWEWTASPYRPSPEEIADRDMAWGNAWKPGAPWFVIKGGSYFTPSDDLDLLVFFRAANPADVKIPFQGFRCAMDPQRR